MTEPGFEPSHFTPEPEKTLIADAGRATDSGPQSRQTVPRWERPLFWVRSSGKMRRLYLFHGFFVTLCPSWKGHCAAGNWAGWPAGWSLWPCVRPTGRVLCILPPAHTHFFPLLHPPIKPGVQKPSLSGCHMSTVA